MAMPTAGVAVGKGFADCVPRGSRQIRLCRPRLCRLPRGFAVGKAFADWVYAFADRGKQSAKRRFPVVIVYLMGDTPTPRNISQTLRHASLYTDHMNETV